MFYFETGNISFFPLFFSLDDIAETCMVDECLKGGKMFQTVSLIVANVQNKSNHKEMWFVLIWCGMVWYRE